ncbi:sialate O-acetylesterase [Hymenobacter nivis]|uniref:Sialate O-acetylesterase n=1 Tax=Hymenobacter nivis TaxID=1850093 RepID=A0A2Z3GH80_9BACT|nr:sialate O-acetylesterase [Hymenobacter nivis]AWM31541.1 sialate O-acetylesterase [Hymenobacter nivis]
MAAHFRLSLLLLLACLTGHVARATVRLPALVGSHMVLKRDQPLRLWGWAGPSEAVRLTFRGRSYAASVPDAGGRWQATLPAMPAGGPYILTVVGQNTIVLNDVLVGDVWLAAGQSNMQLQVKDSNPRGYQPVQDADQEIAAANYPAIRLFTVRQSAASRPAADAAGSGWQVCSPATVAGFSAVAYFFGREIHQRYQVPVGLLVSSWGGTPAEAWVSAEGLRALPEFGPRITGFSRRDSIRRDDHWQPTALYNSMIAPLRPVALKGIIWYQGESNANRAEQYCTLFPALIADWRAQWGTPLPFLFVQLANYQAAKAEPAESEWAELREAQAGALALPGTGMATAIDVGDAADIHPHNKQAVGYRLALVARRVAYGEKKLVTSGPTYADMAVTGASVRLIFTSVGGLVAKNGLPLQGFAVAGADRVFYWATARLAGDKVLVESPQVPAPVAVRYDWADNPAGNLTNKEDLPAVPFRTDTWPGLTAGRK